MKIKTSTLNLIIVLTLVLIVGYFALTLVGKKNKRVIVTNSLVDPYEPPLQEVIDSSDSFTLNANIADIEWLIIPQARYRISARVLDVSKYNNSNWQERVMPLGVMLGWGALSEHGQIDDIIDGRIVPSAGCLLNNREIIFHSAAFNIIPGDENLKQILLNFTRDDMVLLEGYLINMHGKVNGEDFYYKSGTARMEPGHGYIDVLFVTRLIYGPDEYISDYYGY